MSARRLHSPAVNTSVLGLPVKLLCVSPPVTMTDLLDVSVLLQWAADASVMAGPGRVGRPGLTIWLLDWI
jgi:hypothetical protein